MSGHRYSVYLSFYGVFVSFFKKDRCCSKPRRVRQKPVVLEQLLLFSDMDSPKDEYELLYKKGRLSYVRTSQEGTPS